MGRPTRSKPPPYREIAEWQARMYIYSCYLYDNDFEYVLDDLSYTSVWENVKHYWEHLPDELKERIPYEILDTPSSIGLSALGWRQEDREGAFEWFNRVHGREPQHLGEL